MGQLRKYFGYKRLEKQRFPWPSFVHRLSPGVLLEQNPTDISELLMEAAGIEPASASLGTVANRFEFCESLEVLGAARRAFDCNQFSESQAVATNTE